MVLLETTEEERAVYLTDVRRHRETMGSWVVTGARMVVNGAWCSYAASRWRASQCFGSEHVHLLGLRPRLYGLWYVLTLKPCLWQGVEWFKLRRGGRYICSINQKRLVLLKIKTNCQ